MEEAINFFNAINYLDPKCPKCKTKIEYGITTTFSEEKGSHLCNNCGFVIE